MTQSIAPSSSYFALTLDHEPTSRRMLLWLVAGGLTVWGLILGLGSFLGLDPGTPDFDLRRFAVVTACVGAFLAFWMAALWLRGRR